MPICSAAGPPAVLLYCDSFGSFRLNCTRSVLFKDHFFFRFVLVLCFLLATHCERCVLLDFPKLFLHHGRSPYCVALRCVGLQPSRMFFIPCLWGRFISAFHSINDGDMTGHTPPQSASCILLRVRICIPSETAPAIEELGLIVAASRPWTRSRVLRLFQTDQHSGEICFKSLIMSLIELNCATIRPACKIWWYGSGPSNDMRMAAGDEVFSDTTCQCAPQVPTTAYRAYPAVYGEASRLFTVCPSLRERGR